MISASLLINSVYGESTSIRRSIQRTQHARGARQARPGASFCKANQLERNIHSFSSGRLSICSTGSATWRRSQIAPMSAADEVSPD